MKLLILILGILFGGYRGYAQHSEASYRLFGEITTVDNQVLKGFITWGENKNYWIDFFEASKKENPYLYLFNAGDGVVFYKGGRSVAYPPVHVFCCRFGNIRSMRLTGENEIQLELKNQEICTLRKGSYQDIGNPVDIHVGGDHYTIKWEHISEIRFSQADSTLTAPDIQTVAGILKSPQGYYKGIITWACDKRQSAEKTYNQNAFLNKTRKVIRNKNSLQAIPRKNLFHTPVTLKSDVLFPLEKVRVNMPNVGSVTVPPIQFLELEIIPLSELSLPAYNDFGIPRAIYGEVITRHNEHVNGKLAYDLDETLDIEVIDGKNDNISYRIPFRYIRSVEPKNYKYSFITLRNGNSLSLGDAPDVNRENSGVLVSGSEDIPIYVFWNEVKIINFGRE